MAKSSRQKKQARQKAQAKRAEERRLRARTAREREEERAREELRDPRTPPARVAELIAEYESGSFATGAIARARLQGGAAAGELAEAARMLLDTAPEPHGVGILVFAATAAHENGDEEAERAHIAKLLALADDEEDEDEARDLRLQAYWTIGGNGHHAEAIELIEPYLRDDPDNPWAAELYGVELEHMHLYQKEQSDRDRAAVARFTDRSAILALREAMDAYLDRTDWEDTDWGGVVRVYVTGNLATAEADTLDPEDRGKLAALLREIALKAAEDNPDDDELSVDEVIERERSGFTRPVPLTAFAADPRTPPELARHASDWALRMHYGVWQLHDPSEKPGVWATDLVSGVHRYVAFPPGALDGAPPWTVWLGGVVPVDGIWHSTGNGLRLSPSEGDAVAEFTKQAVLAIALRMGGMPAEAIPERHPIRFGQAEPVGVLSDYEDDPDPRYARVTSQVTAVLIPELAASLHRHRTNPPQLRNTDGEPMLQIDAIVAVTGDVKEKLLAHPDFDWEYDDNHERIVWWGKEIDRGQRDMLLAEMRARMPGLVEEPDDEPQRWIRGHITPGDGQIRVEVNSRERLDRLIRVLTRLGASPAVTDEKRFDPAMDLAWSGTRPAVGGEAPASEGWEQWWLNEPVPALGDRTPREAAADRGSGEANRLEAMLRQLEYDAGLAAARGEKGVDVAWLRAELDMRDD